MRSVAAAFCLLALGASAALAQRAPEIVVPGRPGVPVLMNGVDISWSVVEGDFGLDRPGAMTPHVIYRPFAVSVPYYGLVYGEPGYFPRSGRRPGYGRLEILPPANRRVPPPAPTYYRSWSSDSAPGAVTEYPPYTPSSGYGTPNAATPNAAAGTPYVGGAGQGLQQGRGEGALPAPDTKAPQGSPGASETGEHGRSEGFSQHQSQGFSQAPGYGYSQPQGQGRGGHGRR